MLRIVVAILVASGVAGASAQSIYKCKDSNGKTSYSSARCRDGTVTTLGGGSSSALDSQNLTQSQADLAADCHELVFYQTEPGWKDRAQDRADFDRYCPPLGFRAPLGAATLDFNRAHGEELISKLRLRFVAVPSTTRVYSGTMRVPPLFSNAAFALRDRPAPRPGPSLTLPSVQPGLWRSRTAQGAKVQDDEMCGDPLLRLRAELDEREHMTRLGCTFRADAPTPRSTTITVDCPADRVEGGRSVKKGRKTVAVEAPTPQSFKLAIVSQGGERLTIDGARAGDCKW